ncbi:MAG TPA: polysaccharide biosynthesis/export family protein [Candidatus Acidoferrum sp.]|nr:polysaccharide biosynthesis/export family protein [Candidatus Acidoferrum sp.]HTW23744.1 polysaccharide biosynthesis/export family protein [Candidatus Baltobacteraceae bacterium]
MRKRTSRNQGKGITRKIVLWAALGMLAVPGMAHAQDAKQQPSASGAASATTDPNYVIGAQDVLDINVWKEAELTRSVPVRPDGKISLPLLNDVQAAGLTPTQLSDELTKELKKFITDPQVTVIVTQINSQRVYILGEMTRPGAYPLLPGMNVLQALSSAGGFTPFANLKKIYVLRNEGGKQEKFPFNYKEVIKGKGTDQNIVLKAGDQIVVP